MGKKKVALQSGAVTVKEPNSSVEMSRIQKKSGKVEAGKIYIKASYNNTMVSVTDASGNLITWSSAGGLGFSGPKKATPFASSKIIAAVAERARAIGIKDVEVIIKGIGSGRDSALRSLVNQGFNILSIRDVTPAPHNGPRRAKPRRV